MRKKIADASAENGQKPHIPPLVKDTTKRTSVNIPAEQTDRVTVVCDAISWTKIQFVSEALQMLSILSTNKQDDTLVEARMWALLKHYAQALGMSIGELVRLGVGISVELLDKGLMEAALDQTAAKKVSLAAFVTQAVQEKLARDGEPKK